jgi:DNA-directed RNA polymerase specialized sigma24 family protein
VTRSVLHKYRSIERQTAVMGLSIRRSLSHGWLTYSIPKAEFVADVQQLAWNCLDPLERRVFQLHLLDGRQQPECSRRLRMDRGNFYHAKYRVEQKVGQAFLDAGLYPFNVYFKFAEQAFAVAC